MQEEGTHEEGGGRHVLDGYLQGGGNDSMRRSPKSADSGEGEGNVFLVTLIEVFAQVRAAFHFPRDEIFFPQVPPEVIGGFRLRYPVPRFRQVDLQTGGFIVDGQPDVKMGDPAFLELKDPEVFYLRVRSPQTRKKFVQMVFALSPGGSRFLICHRKSGDQLGVRIGRRPSQSTLASRGE